MSHDILRIADAAKLVSPVDGPAVHETTVRRWSRLGVLSTSGQRVFLRSMRIGRRLYTTQEWLEQFIAHCSADDTPRVISRGQVKERAALEELRARGMRV